MGKIDIWCSNDICPICGKTLRKKNHNENCPNGCYSILGGWEEVTIKVFNDSYLFYIREYTSSGEELEESVKKAEIIEKINYWKEDYHYLAEILERM